ncbi:right-handed parallel beta-helix repeat-containing protein [Mycolicibacterium sp. BiH015]|uniref:right-handed parallel beta-helix repeat-containing protein n=1 Tax=Mycolicibacterium sp. BiH015 TaxID=3018808 RepID=UPI0022E456C9|nr:right-handed parallel beta-helix repeat-containing protein [Mycolicibacterium sp. BiH015]MDA2892628.1 right-handed parallel beta-helix repeat-containing protein [Mycolicibacterium sp. BiH015]
MSGSAKRYRRNLPVRQWLRVGAATAGIGIGIVVAPAAVADDGSTTASSDSAASSTPSAHSAATKRDHDRDNVSPDNDDVNDDAGADPDAQDLEPTDEEVEADQDDGGDDEVAAESEVSVEGTEAAGDSDEDGEPSPTVETLSDEAAAEVAPADGTPPATAPDPSADTGPVALTVASAITRNATPAVESGNCAACWGIGAPSLGQAVTTVINHLFNDAFGALSDLPANPLSDFLEGTLLLVRRTLFAPVSTGVVANQDGTELLISVNSGSIAYFRVVGDTLEVAYNPLFVGAQQFDAAAVTDVDVTGLAACAGFVFTDGVLDAHLDTVEIDSIEFDDSATVAKKVRASVSDGTLWLNDAVRGLEGVRFDADVRLADNAEVDGGKGDVTFAGTVDARFWGWQSLVVTALGTTTFEQAVGSYRPLNRLVTRGIAPLQIKESVDSKTIPLHYMPEYSTNGTMQVKYGIDVAIGSNASQIYEFDTGGPGFFAGYSADFWKNVNLGTDQVDVTYTSGNYYNSVATTTSITIGTGKNTVTTQPILLGAILAGGNKNTGATFDFDDPFAPPVDGRFFGDFGASFGVTPVLGTNEVLANPLFQLPGNLSSGFLAQLGPIGSSPQLTVGVTDALRAQFPYAVPVFPAIGGQYPVSGYQILEAFGFAPVYTVTGEQSGVTLPLGTTTLPNCSDPCLPTIIDSGAPSTNVRLPDVAKPYEVNNSLKPGTTFTATFPTIPGRDPLIWTFVAGTNGSVNAVNYSNETGAAFDGQNVNTGLNMYNDFDVMFDVAQGVIWLRPNGGQATVVFESSATTRGEQSYGQNAVLGGTFSTGGRDFSVDGVTTLKGDTVVDAGRGDVTFSGTVDGPHALTVQSRGATTFVRTVGGQSELSSLSTDVGGSTSSSGVSTTGAQSYADGVSLNGLYEVGSGSFTAAGPATLAGPVGVTTDDGTVTFGGRIDSLPGKGFTLAVSAGTGAVNLEGEVGGKQALGGLAVQSASVVSADRRVTLDGSLGYAAADGLFLGDGVTARFAEGGSIGGFTASGIVFDGASRDSEIRGFTISDNVYDGIQVGGDASGAPLDFSGTVIADNTIVGNGAFGIETVAPVNGLALRGNVIGSEGTSNPWGYVSGGPNTHGIVLAPGDSSGTLISDNTIAYNRLSGITSSGGVQGVWVSGNTIEHNALNGITFATGDFTGTTITANTIRANAFDGISLGAGIGQGATTGGDPLSGYTAAVGHFVIEYANNPDFYTPGTPAADPRIAMQIGNTELTVNLDTGSRGLYFDILQLDPTISLDPSEVGHIFLNSSNRLFFGNWTTQTITFTDAQYHGPDGPEPDRQATATVPLLVVTAIGASTTPAPGMTTASTTFGTTISSGTVTITNGTQTQQVSIVPNVTGTASPGIVTIPGGWWATYADNMLTATTSKLGPVGNFGVGFDRSGQGTAPTTNDLNQAYNAFLNLKEMRDGQMRPGYVISAQGVQLGLDSSVDGFAYTDLAPTGLSQGAQSAPDWQPATGTVTYQGTTYATGQLVIDMGIPSAILTLPGQTPSSQFGGELTVNLLNSGGAVRYDIDLADTDSLLNPTDVAFFNPLAGTYTENMAPQSQQFFNTGRNVFSAFDYLFDAESGYFGLKIGSTPQAQDAFQGRGQFAAAFYTNPAQPIGVTNLTVTGNTITANNGNGVTVNGLGSTGNAVLSNTMHSNGGPGIALDNGANGGQPAPTNVEAKLSAGKVKVKGTVAAVGSYSGQFQVQVFASPASDAGNVEGRRLLGSALTSAGDFEQNFTAGLTKAGDWITVTVSPVTAPRNTSEFSVAASVTQ